MPIFPDAEAVLVKEYETREWKKRPQFASDGEGGYIISTVNVYRKTEYREYKLPWYDDGPTTQQVTTPSGGWYYEGFDNSVRTIMPLIGDHVERFARYDSTWYYEDGTAA